MMRGSAGAVIAAAALSGVTHAGEAKEERLSSPSLTNVSERGIAIAEEPKKSKDEKPPKKEPDKCPGCGLG